MSHERRLNEAAPNLHMTHVSELVLTEGVEGLRNAINFLRQTRDMLKSGGSGNSLISMKFDGAPAIYTGIDPQNGQFFVATKALFNKTPKINYTHGDIDANHPSGPNATLHVALEHLKDLPWDHRIYQGDVMFTPDIKERDEIDDQPHIVFQPNTIAYAVPADSDLGAQINQAKIGVVFHTTYTGQSLDELSANFGAEVDHLKNMSSDVWIDDANIPADVGAEATLTERETEMVDASLSKVGNLFRKLKRRDINELRSYPERDPLARVMMTFVNSLVRQGTFIQDADQAAEDLEDFVKQRWNKVIDGAKREETKEQKREQLRQALDLLNEHNDQIRTIFQIQVEIENAKTILLRKLEQIETMTKHFIRDNEGYRVTSPEGFVAISAEDGSAVKLVDRLEFSANNFNDQLKTWAK